jgi:hypothetical protein
MFTRKRFTSIENMPILRNKRGAVWTELSDPKQVQFRKLLKRGLQEASSERSVKSKLQATTATTTPTRKRRQSLSNIFRDTLCVAKKPLTCVEKKEVAIDTVKEEIDATTPKQQQQFFMKLLSDLLKCAPFAEQCLMRKLNMRVEEFAHADSTEHLRTLIDTHTLELRQTSHQLHKLVQLFSRLENTTNASLDICTEMQSCFTSADS